MIERDHSHQIASENHRNLHGTLVTVFRIIHIVEQYKEHSLGNPTVAINQEGSVRSLEIDPTTFLIIKAIGDGTYRELSADGLKHKADQLLNNERLREQNLT
ncbi:hypothetical protein HYT32_00695 [Candidatus Roizmanbacteria bacterium]|nr:hypothetical protein [Candidatus Roizmanbacteria bacterium]